MQKKTRSLLEELNALSELRDINHVIESRGNNVITSAINLIELIHRSFPADRAEFLEKKLISAIRDKNTTRFAKSVRRKDENPGIE